jgi:BolA family transcriptional regulator, general stress-responsive regulator
MSINQERITLFKVNSIQIEDESHLHAGHAGAATGGGHFKLTIVAPDFEGMSKVARHRAIYAALNAHFPKEIHALTILAFTPSESTS